MVLICPSEQFKEPGKVCHVIVECKVTNHPTILYTRYPIVALGLPAA